MDPIHAAAMTEKIEAWVADLPQICASVRKL